MIITSFISQVIWMFFSGPYYVKTSLTLLTSIVTILALRRTSDDQEGLSKSQKKSIVTILILNLAPFFWIISMIASQVILDSTSDPTQFYYPDFYLIYLSFVAMPVFLTSYNPLVLCCRSSGIRSMIRSWRDNSKLISQWPSNSRSHLLKSKDNGLSTTESTLSPTLKWFDESCWCTDVSKFKTLVYHAKASTPLSRIFLWFGSNY